MNIQLPATIDGVSTRKDGSLGVRISTQELTPEAKVKLMELVGQFGWILFKASEKPHSEDEIPKYDPQAFDQSKSPATRMRGVLFRIFEQDNGGYQDFETYYRARMEALIDKLKEKLT